MQVIIAQVVESERDWGTRPDGYLVALDQKGFDKGVEYIQDRGDFNCYSFVEEQKRQCVDRLNLATTTSIALNGYCWIDNYTEEN